MNFNSSDVSICRKWSCLSDWTQSEILLTMESAEYVLETRRLVWQTKIDCVEFSFYAILFGDCLCICPEETGWTAK
jgi:hypothetical protein